MAKHVGCGEPRKRIERVRLTADALPFAHHIRQTHRYFPNFAAFAGDNPSFGYGCTPLREDQLAILVANQPGAIARRRQVFRPDLKIVDMQMAVKSID